MNSIFIIKGKKTICAIDPHRGGCTICGTASDLDDDDHYYDCDTNDPIDCKDCIRALKSYVAIAKKNGIKL